MRMSSDKVDKVKAELFFVLDSYPRPFGSILKRLWIWIFWLSEPPWSKKKEVSNE